MEECNALSATQACLLPMGPVYLRSGLIISFSLTFCETWAFLYTNYTLCVDFKCTDYCIFLILKISMHLYNTVGGIVKDRYAFLQRLALVGTLLSTFDVLVYIASFFFFVSFYEVEYTLHCGPSLCPFNKFLPYWSPNFHVSWKNENARPCFSILLL